MINIIKPKLDKRLIQGYTLENGMRCIIINDNSLQSSDIYIAVNIGHYADPVEYQGLAHFLEHMLFMGSAKYPDVNYFFNRLKMYGGSANAYTSELNTVYYFNVFNNGLYDMFDIFSRFFIDPLFDKNTLSKEVNAVNEEHLKNINSYAWQLEYFKNLLTDEKSLLQKFGTGSTETLQKDNIRDIMIEFYKKYYVASNISLCIASSLPVAEIVKLINSTFGNISDTTASTFQVIKPFFTTNIQTSHHMISNVDIYKLILLWEIPSELTNIYIYEQFNILAYIINNTSKNSLQNYLNDLGYVIGIKVNLNEVGIFELSFKLTKYGYDNINHLKSIFFSYLNDLYDKYNFHKCAQYIQQMDLYNYEYNNKISSSNLCNMLCISHFKYSTEYVYYNILMITNILDNLSYIKLFKYYINYTNYIEIIINNTQISTQKYNLLKHYNTSYAKIKTVPFTFIKNDINFFKPYNLINNKILFQMPKMLSIEKNTIPTEIEPNIWYGCYTKFNEPLIYINMLLTNKKFNISPLTYILTNISCIILNKIIHLELYVLLELPYSISINNSINLSCINITIEGLNNINIIQYIITKIYNILFNIDKYIHLLSKVSIEKLILSIKKSFENIQFANPIEYSNYILNILTLSNAYSTDTLTKVIDKINYDIICKYIQALFSNNDTSILIFTFGNFEYKNIFNDFLNKFNKNTHLPKIKKRFIRNNNLIKHPNNDESSICITYLFKVGKFVPLTYLLLLLSNSILSQLFFNILRTEKQLGYLVKMAIKNIQNEYYIIQYVQSTHEINKVYNEINNFNNNIIKYINEEDINIHINKLKQEIEEPDYSLSKKYNEYFSEISSRDFLFNKKNILLNCIDHLSIELLTTFIKLVINDQNKVVLTINNK